MTKRAAKLIPVLAYERVSRNPDGTIESVPRQKRINNTHAEKTGLRVLHHFSDELSAWQKDRDGRPKPRPGWDALLAALEAGEFEGEPVRGLLSYHYDRLARNDYAAADLLRVLEQRGMPMFTPNGRHDLGSDADAQMVFRMLIAMAIKSSADTARRIRAQKDDARQRGDLRAVYGGRARYGWANTPGGWVVDEQAAAALREAAGRLLAGEPLLAVYDELAPLADSYGAPVDYDRLRETLLLPLSAGLVTDRDGKVMDEVATVPVPPLDRVTFDRLAILFGARKRGRPTAGRYPLGPLLRCGQCGNQLTGEPSGKYRYYACHNPHPRLGVTKPCRGVGVRADQVHELIRAGLARFAATPSGRRVAKVQLDLGPQFAALEARHIDLQEQMADVTEKKNRGWINKARAAELEAGLVRDFEALAGERAALVEVAEAEPLPASFDLDGLTPAEQRRVVSDVFATPIMVFPGRSPARERVDLRWREDQPGAGRRGRTRRAARTA